MLSREAVFLAIFMKNMVDPLGVNPIPKQSMCCPKSKVTFVLYEKIAKFELNHQKEILNGCSSTLDFFSFEICAYFYFGQIICYV